MGKNLLGVDFGTTSLKACLFNEQGERLATESVKYNLIYKGDFIEFPAEEFFSVFISVYNKIAEKFKIDAMSIDTQGETIILLDKSGKPLMNAIIWLDNRAVSQAKRFEEQFGLEKIYTLTGEAEVPAGYPAPKIMWIKENMPEVFEKTDKFLLLEDYIVYRLTGKCAASRSLYSSSLLMDINTGEYIPEVLSFLGISDKNLSVLHESGDVIGEYNGVLIAASAMDQIAGVTGAGVVKSGMMSETTGTALAVCAITDKLPPYFIGVKVSAYYVKKGQLCLLMWSPNAGATLEWFKSNFCEELSFSRINELAESVPAGCENLSCVPHFCGTVMPENNSSVKGAFVGIELKHSRGHFIRSIMEAVAYNIKEFIDYMGLNITEIRSMGGGANSKLWCEIKSAVCGKKVVTLTEGETACLGSAIFAGIGAKVYENAETAAQTLVSVNKTYSAEIPEYATLYSKYKAVEKSVINEVYSKREL